MSSRHRADGDLQDPIADAGRQDEDRRQRAHRQTRQRGASRDAFGDPRPQEEEPRQEHRGGGQPELPVFDAAREDRGTPQGRADRPDNAGHAARHHQLAKHETANVSRCEAVQGRHEQVLPALRAELIEQRRAKGRREERVRSHVPIRRVELGVDDDRQCEECQ